LSARVELVQCFLIPLIHRFAPFLALLDNLLVTFRVFLFEAVEPGVAGTATGISRLVGAGRAGGFCSERSVVGRAEFELRNLVARVDSARPAPPPTVRSNPGCG
jgi:hypothetical protein